MRKLQASGNREFIKFLSPSDNWTDADKAALKYLVLKFPYCQPLHFANASALRTESKGTYESYLKRASVYAPKRDLLHRFINEPEYFQTDIDLSEGIEEAIPSEVIISRETELVIPEPEESLIETVTPESESLAVEKEEEQLAQEESAIETVTPESESLEVEEEQQLDREETPIETITPDLESLEVEVKAEEPLIETVTPDSESLKEEELPQEESPIETVTPESESLAVEEEEEQLALEESAVERDVELTEPIETVVPDLEEFIIDTQAIADKSEDTIALQSVASSDYFRFNKSFLDPLQPEEKREREEVSRYDDDTMPNTFLWWLHKTRKEYERDFQPYAQKPAARTNQTQVTSPQLNQQIIENIFHIQPELNTIQVAAMPSTVEFELRKKETKIIENFIKEEPQIKPPSMAKVDTENKARKSSEDKLDLVSETLAQIYVDQMLFDKAIETYKKLSLKYPDKSIYFASQIQHLEKKI